MRVHVPTLLPVPVEDLDVLQLHSDARPEVDRVGGVVLAASLDGAVGVSPAQTHSPPSHREHTANYI